MLNGVNKDRIISESKSISTFENIKFSLNFIFNLREKNIKKNIKLQKKINNKHKIKITLNMVSSKEHYSKIKKLVDIYINKSNLKNKININYL